MASTWSITGENWKKTTIGTKSWKTPIERNCVLLFGELCNRLPSTHPDARFPVRLEIVNDGTPLRLIGPNQAIVSAVGMSWEKTTSPYDENNGPRLFGAKLNHCGTKAAGEGVGGAGFGNSLLPNDEFALYGGADFRLRILTTGGFSPDGVRPVKPTGFEMHSRIHALGGNGDTALIDRVREDFEVLGGTLQVVGLSDLGKAGLLAILPSGRAGHDTDTGCALQRARPERYGAGHHVTG